MQNTFQLRDAVNKGPQILEQYLKNKQLTQSQINTLFRDVFSKKKSQFINYLPILMKKNANINYCQNPSEKKTVLMIMCSLGNIQMVKKLLQYNPDCALKDSQNKNALFYAIDYNKQQSIGILNMILQKNPDLVNSETTNKKTLVIYAIQKGNKQIVKLLLQKGANLNTYLQDSMQNPLHIAVKKCRKKQSQNTNYLNIVMMLLQKKCNIGAKNKQGKTPLELCQDQEAKRIIQDSISSINRFQEQEKKKNIGKSNVDASRDVGNRDILKIQNKNSKLVRMNPIIRLNDKNDEYNILNQASVYFEEYIAQRERKLEEQRKKQQKQRERKQLQRRQQIKRSEQWMIPTQQLKYYLEQQIRIFTEQIQNQNKIHKEQFDLLIQQISNMIQFKFNLKVLIYGSYATRLCLKQSDIDLVVFPNNTNSVNQLMINIEEQLKKLDFVNQTKFISTAIIPVIKVWCTQQYKYKKIDITIQNILHNGLNSVDMIKSYMKQYQELKPLAFVLKTFIYQSNLSDTYQGGLSSYGLILMIVAFLQQQYVFKKQNQKFMIADLLIRLLEFFSFKFDYINKAIYVSSPLSQYQYKSFVYPISDPMYQIVDISPKLVLIDPLNINNNVGRSTHQIKTIQMAFCIAHTTIHTNYSCRGICKYKNQIKNIKLPKQYEGKVRPCCILKRMFMSTYQYLNN